MKKKIVAFMLVVAMLAIAIVGGTLAYFTDDGAETNVFTVGSVKIELIESFVHRGAATGYENIEGYPEVASGEHTNEQILAASGDAYKEYLAAQQLMPGIAINKMPYVKNTGNSDAYIRIRMMIPTALDLAVLNSSHYCTTALDEEFTTDVDWANPETVTVDGVEYDVYEFTRVNPLTPGEMTYWNVWNTIHMDADTLQEEVEDLIEAGAIIVDDDGNRQFNVLVQADAIQAASFNSAAQAWAAFDAQN